MRFSNPKNLEEHLGSGNNQRGLVVLGVGKGPVKSGLVLLLIRVIKTAFLYYENN